MSFVVLRLADDDDDDDDDDDGDAGLSRIVPRPRSTRIGLTPTRRDATRRDEWSYYIERLKKKFPKR